MSDDASFQILIMGLELKAFQLLEVSCAGATFTKVDNADDFMAQYEGWSDGMFNAIFCGSVMQGMSSNEAAQVLLNQCPGTLKYYVTIDTTGYEPKNLLKNGFSAAFALPMDAHLLRKTIQESVLSGPMKKRSYRSVRVFDLEGGDKLDFDTYVYLPLNKKHVRFSGANQKMEPAKIEKLQSKQMAQVFVDHKDMQKFYQYSATKLRALGEGGVSSTEKQEKLRDCIRGLFTDIFDQSVKADFDNGKEMIKQCESIISNYITKGGSSGWYKKLMSSIGESGDTYNHASNVSTFAALFAIGIGHKRPEDLAMAGLFHDLGMAQIPEELQNKRENELSDAEKLIYYSHAEKSLNLVRTKRIIVSAEVEKAILQHHEKWNGHGYPKQLPAARLSEDSQLLSLADQFDYLTRVEEGRPQLTPLQALEEIRKNGSINPDIITAVRKLLDSKPAPVEKTA